MKKTRFLKLLSERISGEISEQDNRILEEAAMANSRFAEHLKHFDEFCATKDLAQPDGEKLKNIWSRINHQGETTPNHFDYSSARSKGRFFEMKLIRVAATLLLLFCSALLTYFLVNRNKEHYYFATAGQEKMFKMLDDGTRIWLNRSSSIRYNSDFGKNKREIFLQGEAYFDVVKNSTVPLLIHAGRLDIEVKGTAFNINAYPKNRNVSVALIRGLIQVSDRLDRKQMLMLHPNQKISLPTSETKTEMKSFLVKFIPSAVLSLEINWMRDTLRFKEEKLKDLSIRMEKKYDLKIEIKSKTLQEKHFSGVFTDESIQQAIEALKLAYPFTYSISNRLVVIRD